MELHKAYQIMQAASGISAGDTVKIVRGYRKDTTMGFVTSGLRKEFNRMVGQSVVVAYVGSGYIELPVSGGVDGLYAPFYCLELIEKGNLITIGNNAVKFTGAGIKVGCQEVSKETITKIYERLQ